MNWGTKVLIGMALFMTFIVLMGIKMFMVAADDDLVEKDYYEKGLGYDQTYNEKTSALQDSVVPEFFADKDGLSISFRFPAKYKLVCKRPSDSKLDRVFEGNTDETKRLIIPANELKPGPWLIHLEFAINGKPYLVEREMMLP